MYKIDTTIRGDLLSSQILWTQFWYKECYGREFLISRPIGRESHHLVLARVFNQILLGNPEYRRTLIRIPPRYSKTINAISALARGQALNPSANSLYVTYSHSLSVRQTQAIKQIIEMPRYKQLFGVQIKRDVARKDDFETTAGGNIFAAGSGGTIVGRGAGIKGHDGYGGMILIDDIIKPSEATSDVVRGSINDWYWNTLQSRVNSPTTPICMIGQETHEDSLMNNLAISGDWKVISIAALDENKNALWPEMHSTQELLRMQELFPYEFAAQYQQNPIPSGGSMFRGEDFVLLDEEPEFLSTFITADTAETDKNYNDASAFSFWGIYKIKQFGKEIDMYAIHLIDCYEIRVEPADLQNEFNQFYIDCLRHKTPPRKIFIEKKSTGVTLLSVLSRIQGLDVRDIKRDSTSKTERFAAASPYIRAKQVSLTRYAKHTKMFIEHCEKITRNNTHRHDDLCDNLSDAVFVALKTNIILNDLVNIQHHEIIAHDLMSGYNKIDKARQLAGNNRY